MRVEVMPATLSAGTPLGIGVRPQVIPHHTLTRPGPQLTEVPVERVTTGATCSRGTPASPALAASGGRYLAIGRRRLARGRHLEGVQEVTDQLVEADGDDEIGELVHRQERQQLLAFGVVEAMPGEQTVGRRQDGRLGGGQALEGTGRGGRDRLLAESDETGNVFRRRTASPSASTPGASAGECIIIRKTLSEPRAVTSSCSSTGIPTESGSNTT
ncbi:hypothetical protein ACIP2Y_08085 [Streptomyces sviceus]|uniref:hypothetical protein n=1 Tax=Streptomyces sviceus TaxID=285530 RepID=UPI0037F8DB16